MRKLILAGLLFSLVPIPLDLQAAETDSTDVPTCKWALQIARYEGLSILRHVKPDATFRFGLDVTSHRRPNSPTGYSTHRLDLVLNYLLFRPSSQLGALYFGGGPHIGINRSFSEYSSGDSISWEQTRRAWDLGAMGIIGIRWNLSPQLVLFIENQANVNAFYSNVLTYDRIDDEESDTGIKLQYYDSRLNYSQIGAIWYFAKPRKLR